MTSVPSFTADQAVGISFRQLNKCEDGDPTFWFRGRPITADEATRRLEVAARLAQNPKLYTKKALLTIRWKNTDDSGAEKDCEEMEKLMENDFGFTVTSFQIPKKRTIVEATYAISSFIRANAGVKNDSEEDSEEEMTEVGEKGKGATLLAFYIVSHGKLNEETKKLHICAKENGENDIPFDNLFHDMTNNPETDILIILDSCHAAAMHRANRVEGRTVELVGACGADAKTPKRPASFTRFFVEKARQINKPTTVEELIHGLTLTKKDTPQFSITTRDAMGTTSTATIGEIPWHARWEGIAPIVLVPRQFDASMTPSGKDAYVTVFLHLEEDPTSRKVENFYDSLIALTLAKPLYQLKTTSTLMLIALPSRIWECLPPHSAFLFAGYISPEDLALSLTPSNVVASWLTVTDPLPPSDLVENIVPQDISDQSSTSDSEMSWEPPSIKSSRTWISLASRVQISNYAEDSQTVEEIFQTCYAYGINAAHQGNGFKAEDIERMEMLMNKLLSLKDFYVQNWTSIPAKDKQLLVLFLKRIFSHLCENPSIPSPKDAVMIRNKSYSALRQSEVYQLLGLFSAAMEQTIKMSAEDANYVLGVWERAQRQIDLGGWTKLKAVVRGRSEVKRVIEIVGKWEEQIDLLISSRFPEIWKKKGPATLTKLAEQVQSSDLQHTSATIGVLFTNVENAPKVIEEAQILNSIVPEFSSTALISTEIVGGLPTSSHGLGSSGSRKWAMFSPTPNTESPVTVIIEFKPFTHPETRLGEGRSLQEIRSLVRALRSGSRDPSRFHVLDCLGLVHVDTNAIGIILKVPFEESDRFQCKTLNNILAEDYPLPRLEDRISLATSLAWSLSSFHDASWVHKRFMSDNILMFRELTIEGRGFSWDSPYVVGFELSRPNIAWSGRIDRGALLWRNRVYTRPDRMQNEPTTIKFKKIHDIYSLGVVLLEIGMWVTFTSPDWEKKLGSLPHFEIRNEFNNMTTLLREKMGSVYAEITRRCLNSDLGINEDEDDPADTLLSEAYKVRVCEKLESVRV